MFEFHGWAVIRVPDLDGSDFKPIGRGPEVEAIKRVRAAINEIHDEFSLFEVKQTGNGQTVLIAHGLRNHKFAPVIELFRWVAAELPASYGLLYIHDDEAAGQDNEFRVWRLARGNLSEMADPFLSPYFPTVEPPLES
ncbi:MAG TPA: Imm7 family immunity protein [Humisphaera sp.]|nr:Imm7 family immunity protein [Humisphaera sp.]